MNRLLLGAFAVGSVMLLASSASAQYYGRGCGAVRGYSHSVPYYTYRSYGPGTHISRYAVPKHISHRHIARKPASIHYHRVPPVHSHRLHHVHPYSHRVGHRSVYRYGYYPRSGLSLSIGF